MKQSAKNDVINGNEQQFNYIPDASHNGESQSTRLSNLSELYIYHKHLPATSGFSHTYKNLYESAANFFID
jgi:hypothetical protein